MTGTTPPNDVILAKARRYIELSNQGTTTGMEDIFAVDAVYESTADHPGDDAPNGVRIEGREAILEAHQGYFDSFIKGMWTVPDENYLVTEPGVVEFDIINITIVPHNGVAAAVTGHETMRFDANGMATHVIGHAKGPTEPILD